MFCHVSMTRKHWCIINAILDVVESNMGIYEDIVDRPFRMKCKSPVNKEAVNFTGDPCPFPFPFPFPSQSVLSYSAPKASPAC